MGTIEIEVTSDEGKLRAAPIAHSEEDVVTWIFKGDLIAKALKVRSRTDPLDPSKTFIKLPKSDRASGQPIRKGETKFEFEIVDGEDKVIEWEDGGKGECIKHPVPPPGGSG
ncbi:MAG TPA: hypothetical protein VFC23_20010 [Thermoanaerobaculia bacterium]|nr:hypothetical protein [Thermoanaerobaculia bacterium]